MQHKIKLLNKEENWYRLRNYKPNDTVNHNNKLWQNITGLNSEPNDISIDWINIDYAKKDYVNNEIDKIKEFAVKKINTIADLRNTVGEYEGQVIELLGYYESGDKEPLKYKWSTNQGVDDGGSIINNDVGSFIANLPKDYTKVSHFGIFPNKQENSDVIFNSNQLKNMVLNNIKCLFDSGDYYIRDIEFTSQVFPILKGQSTRKYTHPTSTRILTKGGNFMIFNFTASNAIYVNDIIFLSEGYTGSCFEKIQSSGESDFSIIGSAFTGSRFNKFFYTPSYGTGINISDFVVENNKYGIYVGLASNIARIVKGNILANLLGISIYGYNVLIDQIQLSVNYPNRAEDEVCIGVNTRGATLRNVYNEEYGGLSGATPETHILIRHEHLDNPSINEGLLRLENIAFPKTDAVCHLDLKHSISYVRHNSVKIIADFPREIPRVIRTSNLKKLVQGISVNDNNLTRVNPSDTSLRTTQFYRMPEAKVLTPFNQYTDVTNNSIPASRIDISENNIDGYQYMINTDNTANYLSNKLYDTTHKGVRPLPNSNFKLSYDFSIDLDNDDDVCLVLIYNKITERLGFYKPKMISEGNYKCVIKGDVIRKMGNTNPYTASLGFDKSFKVPNTVQLSSMVGYYHFVSFNDKDSTINRNGL